MENTLRNIRLMTEIEKRINKLENKNLVNDVWNMLGCDYIEILGKVNKVIDNSEIIEKIIPELQYEFQCNQLYKYNENEIFDYLYNNYNSNMYLINNWDMLDNTIIIKTVVIKLIKEIINPIISEVQNVKLDECNYKIND